MAKKQARTVKKVVKKAAKQAVKKVKKSAPPRPAVTKKVARKVAKKKAAPASASKLSKAAKKAIPSPAKPVSPPPEPPRTEPTLGRPLVTQEEKLYMLFHDDYQCRQVFEFLRVETVKELEQFTPHQIVHLMSRPIRLTVDRIRQRLAQFKRSLKDDEHFAIGFRPGLVGQDEAR